LAVVCAAACVKRPDKKRNNRDLYLGQPKWVNNAVGYQVFVRSYKDSNGDTTGDLNGLQSKLPYLADLGVDLLWLNPIFPSSSYHGYDVTDYYDVNPELGTMDDFKNLCKKAKVLGIRVILDLVINHTSKNHPWFTESASNKHNPRRDWYLWREDDPGWRRPWDSKQAVWHKKGDRQYYYGLFWGGMPDLNLENPEVIKEVEKITSFWLAAGADGFRVDAARYLIEGKDGKLCDTNKTHKFIQNLKQLIRKQKAEAVLVAEAWSKTETVADYFGKNNEYDLAFNFDLAATVPEALLAEDFGAVADVLKRVSSNYKSCLFDAPFLENHDRSRIADLLSGKLDQLKMAAALLLSLPGTPFIYYGQELGMKNDVNCQGDLCYRGKMEWQRLKTQKDLNNSLFNWYKLLLGFRKQFLALRSNKITVIKQKYPQLLCLIREDSKKSQLLIVINASDKQVSAVELDLSSQQDINGRESCLLLENKNYRISSNLSRVVLPKLAPNSVLMITLGSACL